MKNTILLCGCLALGGVVAFASVKLLIVIAVMAFGIGIATAIEKEKKDFRPSVVLHKCCATVQWVFITFYLFALDRLPAESSLKPYLIAMIPISGLFYLGLARNTHIILAEQKPELFATPSERKNLVIASVALAIAVFFAYQIERVPTVTKQATQSQKVSEPH